jgi:hypothetical protein
MNHGTLLLLSPFSLSLGVSRVRVRCFWYLRLNGRSWILGSVMHSVDRKLCTRLLAYSCNFLLCSDGWRVVDDDYGQAVGKLQAESMMSTAASLFPQ